MRRTIIFLLILCGIIAVCGAVSAVTTYSEYFEAVEDGHVDNIGTFDNTSTEILSRDAQDYKGYAEFNLSSIPENAHILTVSWYWYSIRWDGAGSNTHVYLMNTRPSDLLSTPVLLWQNITSGKDIKNAGVNWPLAINTRHDYNTTTGEFDATAGWINKSVEDNLTRGWYAIGWFTSGMTSKVSSSEAAGAFRAPALWIEWEETSPIINSVSPSDGQEGVKLSELICVNVSHPQGLDMNITMYWYNGSEFLRMHNWTNVNNGSYCFPYANATSPCSHYYWYVQINDTFGNQTEAIYDFYTHCPAPPTGLTCTRINSTALNISWIPYPRHNGTTNTTIYYQAGSFPNYEQGTLACNTSSNYTHVTVNEATCYYFSAWTWWVDAYSSNLSENEATKACCSAGGDYRIVIYDEDTFNPIDFWIFPNNISTHLLRIHYVGGGVDEYIINNATVDSYGCGIGRNVSATDDVLVFELVWNWKINTSNQSNIPNGACMTGQYRRMLTPEAAVNCSGLLTIPFYMSNYTIYGEYHNCFNSTTTIQTYEGDYEDVIIRYAYDFYDTVGDFASAPSDDCYVSFYTWNDTGVKIWIHQEYWSVGSKIYPPLIYDRLYRTAINSSAKYLKNIGKADTGKNTDVTMTITENLENVPHLSNMTWQFAWTSGTGFWFHYTDTQSAIVNVTFVVKNVNEAPIHNDTSSDQDHNFSGGWYAAQPTNTSYIFTFVFTREVGDTKETTRVDIQLVQGMSSVITANRIETLLQFVCGDNPFYNTEKGTEISYVSLIFGIMSILAFAGLFRIGEAIAMVGTGLLLSVGLTVVSGTVAVLTVAGVMLIVLGIVWHIRGGKE